MFGVDLDKGTDTRIVFSLSLTVQDTLLLISQSKCMDLNEKSQSSLVAGIYEYVLAELMGSIECDSSCLCTLVLSGVIRPPKIFLSPPI